LKLILDPGVRTYFLFDGPIAARCGAHRSAPTTLLTVRNGARSS
jgi:hypothetical protein